MSDDIERLRRGERPFASHVSPPPRFDPSALDAENPVAAPTAPDDDRTPWVPVIGGIALVMIACIPHLVAPAVAFVIALVAAPLSWSLHRVSRGRAKRAYLALAGLFVVILGLAIAAPLVWVQLGVIEWPQVQTR